MIRKERDTTWPFLCILLCLFVLSAVSPRAWERMARSQAVAEVPEPPQLPAAIPEPPEAPDSIATDPATAGPPGEIPVNRRFADAYVVDPAVDPPGPSAEVHQLAPPPVLQQPQAADEEPPLMANTPSRGDPLLRREVPPRREAPSGAGGPSLEPLVPRAQVPGPVAKTPRTWQEPKALLDYLKQVGTAGAAGKWAAETEQLVRQLGPAITQQSGGATTIVRRLRELSDQAVPLAARLDDPGLARKLRQAGYALSRRLTVWDYVVKPGAKAPVVVEVPRADGEQLSVCLNEVDALMRRSPEGRAWREYLMLDALRQGAQRRQASQGDLSRELALEALKRLNQNSMTMQQRQFVTRGPMASLAAELRRLAAEPVDTAVLLQHQEQYEQSRLPSDAWQLARDYQYLAVSSDPQQRELAQRLDEQYRNANLRLAVNAQLLNRLMPPQPLQYAPVHDTVLGMPVRGESLTSTDVVVKLLPDPRRARMSLEVSGEVASLTSSTVGPATFYNRGRTMYRAREILEMDLKGIHPEPAEVEVYNELRLRNLQTDFDGIPILDAVAKGIARSQHEKNRPAANYEIRRKVAAKARERIDAEAKARLGEFSQRLQQRVLNPMYALSLDPTMISAETTAQRFLMRLRLAGENELGSHTPRPQAPSDSLASFQVHESAINNALQGLKLEGKTFTLSDLSDHISEKFICDELWETNPEYDDVRITFAAQNALEVRCQDGQVVLTVSIAKLSKAPHYWKDFQVRAFYKPQIEGRSAELTRDGIIHLLGDHLNTGSQLALRGIFAKVFSKNTPWDLTPPKLVTSPQLADLEITQFTIDDGWVGVALGPKRAVVQTARRSK